MVNDEVGEILSNNNLPAELEEDIERYVNQGGLLGVYAYYLIYLRTRDENLAENAALIPAKLFLLSSLHDDAVDNSTNRDGDLKQYLNYRTTIGDIVYTEVLELMNSLPSNFDVAVITEKMREIGYGQLNEEEFDNPDYSFEEAIARVDERGSVWGELALTPIEAAGYYSVEEIEQLEKFMGNFLFVLTIIDDVEDIPEDHRNGVVNIPLILLDEQIDNQGDVDNIITTFLESDVPDQMDEILSKRETKMEEAITQFYENTGYSKEELLSVWHTALYWYINSISTAPLEEYIPSEKKDEISKKVSSGKEEIREYILGEIMDEFPARFETAEEFVDSFSGLPEEDVKPAVMSGIYVKELVKSVMTVDLDDALDNLEERSHG